MKISVNYGRRDGDQPLVLEVSDTANAVEIYNEVETTHGDSVAALVLEAISQGQFTIAESQSIASA